jgi:ERCC4-type nuclease
LRRSEFAERNITTIDPIVFNDDEEFGASIPDLLTIERKTISDLVVSITEDARRLFHQTDAMTMVPGSSVLLLEGDVYGQQRLTLPNIAGTLSYWP